MNKIIAVLVLTLFFAASLTAQILMPTRFTLQNLQQDNSDSFILGLANNDIMMFWYDSINVKIKSAKSTDGGSTWINENIIVNLPAMPNFGTDINAVQLNSGRVLFTHRVGEYIIMYSDDNCATWSQPSSLQTRGSVFQRARIYGSSLTKTINNDVVFVHSESNSNNRYDAKGIFYIKSTDGIFWTPFQTIESTGRNGHWVNISALKSMIVYHDSTQNSDDIFYNITTDGGITWTSKELLLGGINSQKNVRGIKDPSGKIWIFFEDEEQTPFASITQQDINYITSVDDGLSWSNKQEFTTYAGIDNNFALSLWNGKPIIAFSSSRSFNLADQKMQIYFGIGGETIDTNGPPFLFQNKILPEIIAAQEPVTIRAWVLDDTVIDTVMLVLKLNEGTESYHLLFDDGLHNDSLANDNIYGITLSSGFNNGDVINYSYYLTDNNGNNSRFSGGLALIPTLTKFDKYLLETNKLKLPIDNRGVLAAVNINDQSGLKFDESVVLFSGGFLISGMNGTNVWAAGQATSTLNEVFLPGPVGSNPDNIINSIFVVKKDDADFGTSWQQYRFAVLNGADFYDGNNDGIYDPVDLNGNGVWDLNEDKPDFYGDESTYTVFNDGAPSSWRVMIPGEPQGIDIQQTLFAINSELNPIQNMVFVRYRILNRGTVSDNFEKVYFTVWSDPDIGTGYSQKLLGFDDDLLGSDTLLNLGYCYNDSLDTSYGTNPPAIGTAILQGPVVYIPGETYLDVNSNGVFDLGIDTPLDSAMVNNGDLGSSIFPGAKNLGMTSFIYTECGNPILREPTSAVEARFLMTGKNNLGQYTDPCTWQSGSVIGVPCNEVNPIYHFSGDPVNSIGWINNRPCDQRMWINVGPFDLLQNEKVDIWAAYIVGRGGDNLNSVTKLKEYTAAAHNFYKSNFTQLPVGIEQNQLRIDDYELYQNYPNPFNPSTTIRYKVNKEAIVVLKVYNILGQEVTTIVNEFQLPGSYYVRFDSEGLASGVYFYQLQTSEFSSTKKMIILK